MRARLLASDAEATRRLRIAERPGWLRRAAVFLAHSGDSWFWLAGLGVLWLMRRPFWSDLAATLALSILVLAVVVLAVKFSIRRKRPEGEWGAMYRKTDPHSFPSGHAARAALIAVLALGLAPLWLKVILVVWAPLVSLARIAMGVHYLSDVAAGMLLGAAFGLVVLAVI